ncbi:MAG: hypothetical protein ACR2NO_04335 [Chloroflexota bacterium]
MAERVTCADCGAVAADDASRCAACGSRRLQGQPDLYSRRWVLGGVLAVAGSVVLLLTLLALVIPVTLLANAGITLPGEGERRVRSLDRQWDIIREVERHVPVYPGAQRVKEVHETIAEGRARALGVCWAASEDFDTVRRFYVSHLADRTNGWQPLAGGSRVFKKGRVHLAVTPADVARPACAGTYQLSFSYQI